MGLRKAILVSILVVICCGFTDAKLTGVWVPSKIAWIMTDAKIPSAGIQVLYFAPSGGIVVVDCLVEKDEHGLAHIDIQDDTGVYFGALRRAPPTRVKYKLVDGADYVTNSGKEVATLVQRDDGAITFHGVQYRRLHRTGGDAGLYASFQRLLNGSPGLRDKLSKQDFCLECGERK